MHKFSKILTAIIATAACSSAAHAADLIQDFPPLYDIPSQAMDWNGFYAGVFAGYGAGRPTSDVTPINVEGALLGGTIGANAQYGSFVLGVEGDLAWSNVKGSATCVGNPTFDCSGKLDWLSSGKLRGGVALDNLLLFGTAGIAAGGITASVDPIPGGASGSFSSTVWGWTLGAGAEYAVSENVSVKAEYSYYDFATVTAPVNTLTTVGTTNIDAHAHVAKLGVNYRF